MISDEPSPNPWRRSVTGTTAQFTAKHDDQVMNEGVHEHTWHVTAFYDAEPLRDGRALKAGLRMLLDTFPDADGVLPPDLWSGEALAERVATLLAGCVGVRVWRSEGFEATYWAPEKPMKIGKTIYLCGPINGCTDEEANDWRTTMKALWPGRCLDPMRRDYRGKEVESYREIVELDKIDVASSDLILVNYDKPSVGTSMEVLYAWQLGKPVVVVCRADANISPWLRYHSHAMVHSFAEAITTAQNLIK